MWRHAISALNVACHPVPGAQMKLNPTDLKTRALKILPARWKSSKNLPPRVPLAHESRLLMPFFLSCHDCACHELRISRRLPDTCRDPLYNQFATPRRPCSKSLRRLNAGLSWAIAHETPVRRTSRSPSHPHEKTRLARHHDSTR